MPFDYEKDPKTIERESFRQIRALTDLSVFDREQQQVAMRIVHCFGRPELVTQLRMSREACAVGIQALAQTCTILCDVEMVKQGITKRMLTHMPRCFLNDAAVAVHARQTHETRSMAALEQWHVHIANAVVVIGNAPTALFRLLERLDEGWDKPALIIGMPVGFVGAAESKQTLWDHHQRLGVECITLLGREGGSAAAAATCNALLRCSRSEYY